MKLAALIIFVLILSAHSTTTQAAKSTAPGAWPLRYVILADTESWYMASLRNSQKTPPKNIYLEAFFMAKLVHAQGAKERLAVMLFDFDNSGKVATQTIGAIPLQGSLDSEFLHLVTPQGYKPSWDISTHLEWLHYQFDALNGDATWEEGRMILCNYRELQRQNAVMINDVDGPTIKIKLEPEEGIFYCNDWSRQLANPNRPWIDVTSYEKRGPRVRKFQGYGLFGVTKPVVGKHYKTWICFADCPDGKPGPIADIKAWSKQHGLPVENRNFGL